MAADTQKPRNAYERAALLRDKLRAALDAKQAKLLDALWFEFEACLPVGPGQHDAAKQTKVEAE